MKDRTLRVLLLGMAYTLAFISNFYAPGPVIAVGAVCLVQGLRPHPLRPWRRGR